MIPSQHFDLTLGKFGRAFAGRPAPKKPVRMLRALGKSCPLLQRRERFERRVADRALPEIIQAPSDGAVSRESEAY